MVIKFEIHVFFEFYHELRYITNKNIEIFWAVNGGGLKSRHIGCFVALQ
jgi:hypothetical protein